MSWEKEIGFFTGNYEKGLEWYERHFDGWSGENAVGEACPQYISDPRAPRRIAEHIPDAGLIFLLRDPVERAWSQYLFDRSLAKKGGQPFSELIRTERGYRSYIKRGFYADHLQRYLERFDRSQLLVLFTENLRTNRMDAVQRCFRFLDVDEEFEPDVGRRHNVTGQPGGTLAYQAIRLLHQIRNAIRPNMPLALQRLIKPVYLSFRSSLTVDTPAQPMPESDRVYLRNLFEPHNARLSELLGTDVSKAWPSRRPGVQVR